MIQPYEMVTAYKDKYYKIDIFSYGDCLLNNEHNPIDLGMPEATVEEIKEYTCRITNFFELVKK